MKLRAEETSRFRRAAARIHSQYRPDVAVAPCLLARAMSRPKVGDFLYAPRRP